MKLIKFAAIVSLALVAGCVQPLDPSTPAPSAADAYFVMGISNQDTKVLVVAGTINGGVFDASYVRRDSMMTFVSKDGYVVGKVPTGAPLAVVALDTDTGWRYSPCKSVAKDKAGNALVFEAEAGKVVYLTDLTMVRYFDYLKPQYHLDIARARDFMRSRYPQLAPALAQGVSRMVRTGEC